ncbi:outer membrane transport protein [Massilia arenosa]|uniref:Outer membrane transport protein n=1 Tax=Zemynaea arenosa TaxID=2561931 RepID=A0A4Y9SBX1_9BURK|nr:outer membrane protein transport protein [Massilia arenosa]TFW19736.1 outer membrane transport protein [Massilia arenosa]
MKRYLLPGLLAGSAGLVHAGVTDNLVVSPRAMALGNAVTADPGGIESIHFNPAGLASLTGYQHTDTLFIASIRAHSKFKTAPDIDIGGFKDDPINNTETGPVRQAMALPFLGIPKARLPAVVVPGLGFSWNNPGSRLTFATGVYLSQAMSIDRTKDANDPGRFDGRLIQLQRLVYLSPAIGYKLTDTLKVGISVPIAYANFAINTDFRAPNKLLGTVGALQKGVCPNGSGNIIDTLTFGLCGGGPEGMVDPFKKAANIDFDMHSSFDPTVNLGVLWEPKPWFALGAVYQGGTSTTFVGTYNFHSEPMLRQFVKGLNSSLLGPIVAGVAALPQEIPEYQSGNLTAKIPFPFRVQVGMKLKVTDYAQLNVDAMYADWKKWEYLTFRFDQSIKLLEMARLFGHANSTQATFPMGFRSVTNMAYGLQLFPTKSLTLRFGYEPRKSSIPGDKISLLTPLPDTKLKSVGVRYQFHNGAELNVTGSYMKGTYNVPARTDCNLNCDGFFNLIYNPYAATTVSGDLIVRYFGVSFTRPF